MLIILLVIFILLDIFSGSVDLTISDIFAAFSGNDTDTLHRIVFNFRIPKAATAILAGIALSVSGLQMQTVFRNPMAGPDVLGISSGASLGVAFVILGFSTQISAESISGLGNWLLIAASWTGAGAIMILIMSIGAK